MIFQSELKKEQRYVDLASSQREEREERGVAIVHGTQKRIEKNAAAEARRVETERNLEKGTAAEMKREE